MGQGALPARHRRDRRRRRTSPDSRPVGGRGRVAGQQRSRPTVRDLAEVMTAGSTTTDSTSTPVTAALAARRRGPRAARGIALALAVMLSSALTGLLVGAAAKGV